MIYERLIKNIEGNYQNHLKGGFNFIPIGFDRFSKFVPGIVKSSYTIVTASSGVGKCLGKGTKIIMYDGTIKKVEDIVKGDLVMGVDSTPRTVLNTTKGIDDLYLVKQNKGLDYIVNSNHILSLRNIKKKPLSWKVTNWKESGNKRTIIYDDKQTETIVNINVREYINKNSSYKNLYKGYKVGVEFEEKKLNFDPYIIGCWLGDGTSQNTSITNIDNEVLEYCKEISENFNLKFEKLDCGKYLYSFTETYTIKIYDKVNNITNEFNSYKEAANFLNTDISTLGKVINNNYKNNFKSNRYEITSDKTGNTFLKELQRLNLIDNKHIPNEYLINSRANRLQLLAGLIDTDGSLTSTGVFEITQKNKTLAENVVYLSRSLGFYTTITEKQAFASNTINKNKSTVYRIVISGKINEVPVKIKRKIPKLSLNKPTNSLSTGINVELIGKGEYYGFELDKDCLFLLEDFTVTHNSKFVRNMYIVNVLDFIKLHPEIKVIIPIFSLELSAEEYLADILCSFLYRDYNIEISYRELLSIHAKDEEVRVNQDIIDKLSGYRDWIDFFNKCTRIYSNIHNPYGIYKKIKEIIVQTVKGKESSKLDDEGHEMKFWDYDDENIFVIPIIDQLNLLATEKNLPDLRSAMIKFSSDYALNLKNYYQCHLIAIQQQSSDKERIEHDMSGKSINSKLEPSLDGLGDCKTTQRDATEVIGVFGPDRYDMTEHSGYNITIFKDTYRSIKLLKSRYTSPNKKIGMLFRGGIGTFEELPRPEEFQSDRDYIKYLTEKGVIKEEKKEVIKRDKIKLGTFKTES